MIIIAINTGKLLASSCFAAVTYIILLIVCAIIVRRSPGGRWNFGVVHICKQRCNRDTRQSLYQTPPPIFASIPPSLGEAELATLVSSDLTYTQWFDWQTAIDSCLRFSIDYRLPRVQSPWIFYNFEVCTVWKYNLVKNWNRDIFCFNILHYIRVSIDYVVCKWCTVYSTYNHLIFQSEGRKNLKPLNSAILCSED